ncbi:hypothetical protein ABFS82_11G085600 [Erythranthe guttata]
MAPNTLILRAIPGLNEIRKALLGTVAEQVMLLENIGTSVLVSGNQLPELHALMVEAASILNIDTPDLYLRQSPVSNAYTLAISGKKPFVVVHTSLVELLSRKELQCDHGLWLTYANILTLGAYSIPECTREFPNGRKEARRKRKYLLSFTALCYFIFSILRDTCGSFITFLQPIILY